MEKHHVDPPPVHVHIVAGTYDVQVTVSDEGGGMPRKVLQNIWNYGYSGFQISHPEADGGLMAMQSVESQQNLSGFGVGLPLSRLYTDYLGGGMNVNQVTGYGVEMNVILPRYRAQQDEDISDM